MLNGLSLFSGIGGLDVALSEWVRPIAYCEIDPYCQGVLLSRQMDGDLCAAPIWDDVKTLAAREFECKIDIIYAGFPCQDISVAGAGKGLEGERSGLFYEIVRLCREINPRFLFLENVPAITVRGGTEVVREIASLGYDCRWCVISASSIGAIHRRERWFLLAHSDDNGSSSRENRGGIREGIAQGGQYESTKSFGETERTIELPENVANSESFRLQEERFSMREKEEHPGYYSEIEYGIWNKGEKSPPPFLRMDDDVPRRVDRVKAIGNAVVPQQAKEAFKILMGLK